MSVVNALFDTHFIFLFFSAMIWNIFATEFFQEHMTLFSLLSSSGFKNREASSKHFTAASYIPHAAAYSLPRRMPCFVLTNQGSPLLQLRISAWPRSEPCIYFTGSNEKILQICQPDCKNAEKKSKEPFLILCSLQSLSVWISVLSCALSCFFCTCFYFWFRYCTGVMENAFLNRRLKCSTFW